MSTPQVGTIDIIIVDGKVASVDINCTRNEAIYSLMALVEEIAQGMELPPVQLLGLVGSVLCPDNCVVIGEDNE